MPFRTILAVTAPGMGNGDLKLAGMLCDGAGAHLSVLVIQMAAPPPIGKSAIAAVELWQRVRQEDERGLADRQGEVTRLFSSREGSVDIAVEHVEFARSDEAIGRRGRYADLTLITPEVITVQTLKSKVLEGALCSSGGPLLLMPDDSAATLTPRRILIAWDSSIEAARAVKGALAMLVAADDVRLVLVDPVPGEGGHGAEPGADAAAYLARHGVRISVERLPSEGRSVADVLRRRATDLGAEMLVMGGYGHSRLRQLIFGGVTSSILESPHLPVFMAR